MSAVRLQSHDTTERLGPDDMASLREQQHLEAALIGQQQRAQRTRGVQGTCSNCGEACHPSTVYCDEDCRADHEHRETTLQRQGRR